MKRERNRKPTYYLYVSLLLCVALFTTTVLVDKCSAPESADSGKWGRVNADDSYVTGQSAEGTQSVTSRAPQEGLDYQMQEAPSEGLSQEVYECLEQPAPLSGKPEVILFKTDFIVSYNTATLCPNYVAWHLTPNRLKGSAQRLDQFSGDMVLSERLRVLSEDYAGSGYDRGHLCPAADNRHSATSMSETFLMTNVCPQSHGLNEGDWNELEQQCRSWVRNYGDLYIVAGPIFDSNTPRKIGRRKHCKISVPDRFYKVILSMGSEPKAIGFVYSNEPSHAEMRSYAVSVSQVERITGIDFFPNLPDDMERRVERTCNPAAWGI